MDKKFLKIAIILFVVFGLLVFNFIKIKEVDADPGSEYNVSGHAWSENIGWIKFSSNTPPNTALEFDGENDYVDINKTASELGIDGTTSKSVSAWAYTEGFNGGAIFDVGEDHSAGTDFSLRTLTTDNEWRGQFWSDADIDFTYDSKNKWVHFVVTFDGSTHKIYADGNEVGTSSEGLNTDDQNFVIGEYLSGSDYFDGKIDDVRIYNRALSEAEVQEVMSGEDTVPSGLVGYWKFNEGEGTTAYDSTENNNDGTIDGASWVIQDYGVNIGNDGIFEGHAWSSNVGWISFDRTETGTPPASPYNGTEDYIAKISTTDPYEVSGWARALSASSPESGEWDGWIKFSWDNETESGAVSLNNSTKEFEGYAWGGNESNANSQGVIGWLSFNDKDYDGSPGPVDYQVTTTVSFGATVSNLSDSYPCACDQSRIPNLSWEVSQSDDYEYQVQFDNNSDFSSPIIGPNVSGSNATGTFNGTSGSWSPSCTYCCNKSPYNNIDWDSTYYYQVRVKQTGEDTWSSWTSGDEEFTTPDHCYPYSYFLCSYDGETWYDCDQDISDGKCDATDACQGPIPFLPPAEEEIYVKDFSTCHNSDDTSFDAIYCSEDGYDEELCPTPSGVTTYYEWDFVNATSSDGTQDFASSTITILETGEWGISATTTDTHSPDQSCGHEEGAQSGLPLPDWMEVSPY
jgi:hypothetical protein